MKRFNLVSKKWLQGGSALFLLYAALHSGGIAVRLGVLVGAAGCFALWVRSKRQLDAFVAAPKTQEQVTVNFGSELQPQLLSQNESTAYFIKMPVRYPRPVYVHRGGFRLQRH